MNVDLISLMESAPSGEASSAEPTPGRDFSGVLESSLDADREEAAESESSGASEERQDDSTRAESGSAPEDDDGTRGREEPSPEEIEALGLDASSGGERAAQDARLGLSEPAPVPIETTATALRSEVDGNATNRNAVETLGQAGRDVSQETGRGSQASGASFPPEVNPSTGREQTQAANRQGDGAGVPPNPGTLQATAQTPASGEVPGLAPEGTAGSAGKAEQAGAVLEREAVATAAAQSTNTLRETEARAGAETPVPREGVTPIADARASEGTQEARGEQSSNGNEASTGERQASDGDRGENRPYESAQATGVTRSSEPAAPAVSGAVTAAVEMRAEATGAAAQPALSGVAMRDAAGSATAQTPVPPAAADAVAVQAEWLATRGGGVARLALHPADLGEISIRVALRGTAVDIVIVAQEAAAQAIAEEQSERLGQALSQRDLRLENFEARRSDGPDLSGEEREGFAEARDGHEEGTRSGQDGIEVGTANSRGEVDLDALQPPPPRIVSAGPEPSVDLHI